VFASPKVDAQQIPFNHGISGNAGACSKIFVADAKGAEQALLPYKPGAAIAVVLGPNLSTDRWKELKVKEALKAQEEVGDLFAQRGFRVISKDQVDAAVAKLGLDMTSEEQWTKANLYRVGKELDVEMVAFSVIKETRQKEVSNILLGSYYEGEAELEAWLVDARAEAPILNDQAARGIAKRGMRDATKRRLAAVTFAVDKAFEDLLKPFPKLKTNGKSK